MIELVMTVCLANQPGDCREVRFGFVEGIVDQMSCRKMGMLEAARWAGEHPAWVVTGYRCGPPRQDA